MPRVRLDRGTLMGLPARGYSWDPFQPGHVLSVKSGATSPRAIEPVAEALTAGILEQRPDLERHPFAVAAWARAEARALLIARWFADGIFDKDGNERPGVRRLVEFERMAAQMREKLGLDPRSEAQLAKERVDAQASAYDLDGIMAAGRAALEARVAPPEALLSHSEADDEQ
jgi:hypothetical protein